MMILKLDQNHSYNHLDNHPIQELVIPPKDWELASFSLFPLSQPFNSS